MRGTVRLTFDPQIFTWDHAYGLGGVATPLGAGLSGDTVGAATIPSIAGLQQDVRAASGVPGFIASIGQGLLSVYRERRITPGRAEFGVTNRLALTLTVPLVRTATRTAYQLSPTGANLGPNPLFTVAGAAAQYSTFFNQFNGALTQLGDSLSGGHYGCPEQSGVYPGGSSSSPKARSSTRPSTGSSTGSARQGLPGSPFVPRATSASLGAGIDSTVTGLENSLGTYNVAGFSSRRSSSPRISLREDTSAMGHTFVPLLNDSVNGFGYEPFRDTFRYGLGNIEVEAKYRVIDRPAYKLALAGIVRLPTATRDTSIEVIDAPIDELGGGFEGRLLQEISVGGWWILTVAARGGTQDLGTRTRRVAPFGSILVPAQATTTLTWRGGNYAEFDVAPLYHLAPELSAGLTLSYWTKAADHYAYQSRGRLPCLGDQPGDPAARQPARFRHVRALAATSGSRRRATSGPRSKRTSLSPKRSARRRPGARGDGVWSRVPGEAEAL